MKITLMSLSSISGVEKKMRHYFKQSSSSMFTTIIKTFNRECSKRDLSFYIGYSTRLGHQVYVVTNRYLGKN